MKPMLAATLEDLRDVAYPCLVTPKLDGIRCLTLNNVAYSRNLKPIRNRHVQDLVSKLPEGLDGELIVGNFQSTASGIMSERGEPDFKYCIFDRMLPGLGYEYRVQHLKSMKSELPPWVELILPEFTTMCEAELLAMEEEFLAQGYEGVMLRSPESPYKHGRSSLREFYLVKYKRWVDAEGVVAGYEEERANLNPQVVDELGRNRRPGGAGLTFPKGTLGSLLLSNGTRVGGGFTAQQRKDLWEVRDTLIGRVVTYRYQDVGVKDKPRFPRFLRFRDVDA